MIATMSLFFSRLPGVVFASSVYFFYLRRLLLYMKASLAAYALYPTKSRHQFIGASILCQPQMLRLTIL